MFQENYRRSKAEHESAHRLEGMTDDGVAIAPEPAVRDADPGAVIRSRSEQPLDRREVLAFWEGTRRARSLDF